MEPVDLIIIVIFAAVLLLIAGLVVYMTKRDLTVNGLLIWGAIALATPFLIVAGMLHFFIERVHTTERGCVKTR